MTSDETRPGKSDGSDARFFLLLEESLAIPAFRF